MTALAIKIKHAGKSYDVVVDTDASAVAFKEQIFQLTGVEPAKVKVVVKGGMLKVRIVYRGRRGEGEEVRAEVRAREAGGWEGAELGHLDSLKEAEWGCSGIRGAGRGPIQTYRSTGRRGKVRESSPRSFNSQDDADLKKVGLKAVSSHHLRYLYLVLITLLLQGQTIMVSSAPPARAPPSGTER